MQVDIGFEQQRSLYPAPRSKRLILLKFSLLPPRKEKKTQTLKFCPLALTQWLLSLFHSIFQNKMICKSGTKYRLLKVNMGTMGSEPPEELPGTKWVQLQHREQPKLLCVPKPCCLLEEAVIAAHAQREAFSEVPQRILTCILHMPAKPKHAG